MATVAASGPFSIFKGWWRHSIVVAGDGLRLDSERATLSLKPHHVVNYDGGANWSCTVEGERASVMNVMCESHVARATVEITGELRIDAQGPIAVLPVNCGGVCHVDGKAAPFSIPPGFVMVSEAQIARLTCRIDGEQSAEGAYLLAIQIEPLTVEKRVTND
jgi:environmental stress-induced protein Ves